MVRVKRPRPDMWSRAARIAAVVLASLLLGATLRGSAFRPRTTVAAAPKAYVGLFKDNAVAVFDTGSRSVIKTIPVPTGPHGLVITPNGRTVYVSSDGDSTVSL